MTSPSVVRGQLRAARAMTFGLLTVALASMAHVAGGDDVPSVILLLALTVPVAAVALWLTRRQRDALVMAAVVGATQWILHQVFMAVSAMPSLSSYAGAHGTHARAAGMPITSGAMDSVAQLPLLPGPGLTIAHIVAAAALALVLAHGERLLVLLVALVHLLLRPRAMTDATLASPWTPALVVGSQWSPRPWSVVLAVGRRGPP